MRIECPNCKFGGDTPDDKVPEQGATLTCPKCKTKFHVDKPASLNLHQESTPPPKKKNCRFCGEEILAVAIKCKHCGSMLEEETAVNLPQQISVKSEIVEVVNNYATMNWDSEDEFFIYVKCPKCNKESKIRRETATKTKTGYTLSGEGLCACGMKFDSITQSSLSKLHNTRYICFSCKKGIDDLVNVTDKWIDKICTECSFPNSVYYSKNFKKAHICLDIINDFISIPCGECKSKNLLKVDKNSTTIHGNKCSAVNAFTCGSCYSRYKVSYTYNYKKPTELVCIVEQYKYISKVKSNYNNKFISETRATCIACGHVWHFTASDAIASASTKLGNAAKTVVTAGGLLGGFGVPTAIVAMMPYMKKEVDTSICPKCNSRAIKYAQVAYEKPTG